MDTNSVRQTKEYKKTIRHVKYNSKTKGKRICYYCGKRLRFDETTVDHVIPLCRGGKTELDNLVIACEKCNREKGSMTKDEFLNSETNNKKYINGGYKNERNFSWRS